MEIVWADSEKFFGVGERLFVTGGVGVNLCAKVKREAVVRIAGKDIVELRDGVCRVAFGLIGGAEEVAGFEVFGRQSDGGFQGGDGGVVGLRFDFKIAEGFGGGGAARMLATRLLEKAAGFAFVVHFAIAHSEFELGSFTAWMRRKELVVGGDGCGELLGGGQGAGGGERSGLHDVLRLMRSGDHGKAGGAGRKGHHQSEGERRERCCYARHFRAMSGVHSRR